MSSVSEGSLSLFHVPETELRLCFREKKLSRAIVLMSACGSPGVGGEAAAVCTGLVSSHFSRRLLAAACCCRRRSALNIWSICTLLYTHTLISTSAGLGILSANNKLLLEAKISNVNSL